MRRCHDGSRTVFAVIADLGRQMVARARPICPGSWAIWRLLSNRGNIDIVIVCSLGPASFPAHRGACLATVTSARDVMTPLYHRQAGEPRRRSSGGLLLQWHPQIGDRARPRCEPLEAIDTVPLRSSEADAVLLVETRPSETGLGDRPRDSRCISAL